MVFFFFDKRQRSQYNDVIIHDVFNFIQFFFHISASILMVYHYIPVQNFVVIVQFTTKIQGREGEASPPPQLKHVKKAQSDKGLKSTIM